VNIFGINLILIIIYGLLLLKLIKTRQTSLVFLIAVTFQLIFINGLRAYTIGVDTRRYQNHFYNVNDLSSIQEFLNHSNEIGYKILQKFVGIFHENFNFFLLIVAIIVFFSLLFYIKRYSKDYLLSYILFITLGLYNFTFSGIRQSLAISMGLIAFHYAVKKNLKLFTLFLLIAMSFHVSAIVLIPIYVLVNVKFVKVHYFVLFFIYALFLLFRNQIGYYMSLFYYGGSVDVINNYDSAGTIGTLSLFILFILLLGLILKNPFKIDNGQLNHGLFNIVIVSFFIQTLSSFSYLFTRLNFYYLIFIIIYIPLVISPTKNLKYSINPKLIGFSKLLIKSLIIIALLVSYFGTLESTVITEKLVPFYFFWE